jgi:hypothetical protein
MWPLDGAVFATPGLASRRTRPAGAYTARRVVWPEGHEPSVNLAAAREAHASDLICPAFAGIEDLLIDRPCSYGR